MCVRVCVNQSQDAICVAVWCFSFEDIFRALSYNKARRNETEKNITAQLLLYSK